jgi:hypothetical protein
MQRLPTHPALMLALLLDGCAPPPIYRQPGDTQADGGAGGGRGMLEDGPARDGQSDGGAAPSVSRPDATSPDQRVPGGTGEPPARQALLVVATPATLPADDATLKTRLEARGFVVTVGDDDGPATQADGTSLVVISGSVASAPLGSKYRDTTAPVVCLEAFAFGNMNLTGPTRDVDFGQVDDTQITIVLDTHAIAAHHPMGNLIVATATTSLGWGAVPASAEQIAALVGVDNRDTVFAYEAGAMMVGLVAPGRRVGLFPASPTPDRLNMAGWDIFDAAIDWATR